MDLQEFEDERFDLESLDTEPRLGRRQFLIAGLATGAAATALPNYAAIARKRRIPVAKSGTFPLGVAAGIPYPKGTILWTKLGETSKTSRLELQVARDRHFKNIVLEKTVTARKDRDFTARTRVRGLKPSKEYFYRFHTKDKGSPVGRFRTSPPRDSNASLRIAFLSCQSFEAGFYNAHAAIAKEPDLDFVLHLGDYIYESHYYDGPRKDTSGYNHDGNVEFLPEYRQKYNLYKSDPDLRAMHAAHNFVAVWDDHEVEDNYADGLASSHAQPGQTNNGLPRRVSIQERRANAYQAYFNYMPRLRFDGDRDRIYEHIRIGKLVDLIITDERQYRSQQPCNDAQLVLCPDQQNPNRTMLGIPQKSWFKETLASSPQTWKLWANEVMLMGFQSGPQNGANNDQWDGYAHERKELLEFALANNVRNLLPITGDIHNFFVGTATTDGSDTGTPVCGEFVGGSTTSHGLPEETGLSSGGI
ncbi:MAG TPA: alkaline phosphatase D family protein, partial [Gemmataceae bacterium]|nr:alkaline phosphatase D family protein [Gemmataceae bacterium]